MIDDLSAELSCILKVLDPRNRSEIDRNRFAPVCGHRGICGLALSGLGADLGQTSTILGRSLKSVPGPFSSAESCGTDL